MGKLIQFPQQAFYSKSAISSKRHKEAQYLTNKALNIFIDNTCKSQKISDPNFRKDMDFIIEDD